MTARLPGSNRRNSLHQNLHHPLEYADLEGPHVPSCGSGDRLAGSNIERALMKRAFDHVAVEITLAKVGAAMVAFRKGDVEAGWRVIDGQLSRAMGHGGDPIFSDFIGSDDVLPDFLLGHRSDAIGEESALAFPPRI